MTTASAERSDAPYGFTEDDTRFWESAREGRLEFQKCDKCDFVRWPAAGVCPECLSRSSKWVEVEGKGTLWSHVVYHRAYLAEFKAEVPYSVGLVTLDCGVQLLTRLVDMPTGGPRVDMRVEADFRELGSHGIVPVFRPAS